jgi:hypothetical protein
MRSFEALPLHDNGSQFLRANATDAESGDGQAQRVASNSTGFSLGRGTGWNAANQTYIYMAIRRGPLAPPTAATEVFALQQDDAGSAEPAFRSSFPVDLAFTTNPAGTSSKTITSRLQGAKKLGTHETNAEESFADALFDYMNGWNPETSQGASVISYMWKRAPSFFDVVATTSASSTVGHNLGVAPELAFFKRRDGDAGLGDWYVSAGLNGHAFLNKNNAWAGGSTLNIANLANATTVNTGSAFIGNGYDMIIYLFATLDGVSKVGLVSHSGTTNVDCGFSNGARFVLLKRTNATGDWYVWDSVRGIVAGNDPYFLFNSSAAQVTNTDFIDPLNAGFTISDAFTDGDYIFYAIA